MKAQQGNRSDLQGSSGWVFILLVCFSGMVGCAVAPEKGQQGKKLRKDVLFVIVDDLNKALSVYGHSQVYTPNIDRLARMGIVFENAHCNYSVCNPSRSSLLTGLRPETTTVLHNRIPLQSVLGDRVTLPALFKENGYHTVNIGKIFHRPEAEHNDLKAWDEFYNFRATDKGQQGAMRNLSGDVMRWCYWRAAEGTDEDQPDGQTARKAVEVIKTKRDRPLFLAVGLAKPHDPYVAPKEYFDLYPLDSVQLHHVPESWSAPFEHAFPLANPVFPKGKEVFNEFTERDKREFLRSYYACITFMDAQLGKILDALEETGKLEDTEIFFFGDHGYHLGEHDWWNKFTLYERATSAPFIVAGPSVEAKGSRTEAMIEFVDIYPTLVQMVGLENVPSELEGRSFDQMLRQPDEAFRLAVRAVMTRQGDIMGKSVKTKKWRYIEWEQGRLGSELYDQQADPMEYNNLAGDLNYASIVMEMKELLITEKDQ